MELKRWLLVAAIAVSALQAAPQLQLSNTAFGPINIPAGTNGPTQNVQINNIGDGNLSLSVAASASWLVPTLQSGNLQIALNTAALATGTYTEFVTVSSPGAIDAPQTISVTVTVGGVPGSLEFFVAPNGGSASQPLQTQGQVATRATTSDGRPWLSVGLNGSFSFFYPYLVIATSQAGQPVGDYSGTIGISGSPVASDNRNVAVTLHVTSQPILQFNGSTPLKLSAVAGGGKVSQTFSVSNAGASSATLTVSGGTATTVTGGNWLSVTSAPNNQVTVTADPAGLQNGVYSGTVTLASNAVNTVANAIPVQLIVGNATAPTISVGGVVDNTTFKPLLAPGAIASLFGSQLFGGTPASAASLPLSTTLSGVRVLVNNVPAPVYYASANQINFLVPQSTQPGTAQISVQYNGQQGNTVTTTVQNRAPRILRLGVANYGIIVNQDGTFPVPTTAGIGGHPAKVGDVLTIYCIDLGTTSPAVADGAGAPASEPLARTPPATVTIGGGFSGAAMQATVYYSGLTPGFVGLYQVNAAIPDGVALGNEIGLIVSVEGATSNNVFLAIGN